MRREVDRVFDSIIGCRPMCAVTKARTQRMRVPGTLLSSVVGKEVLHGDLMNTEQFVQALDGDVDLAAFNSPIVDPWKVVVISKIFGAAVPFALSELNKFLADLLEGLLNGFFFHWVGDYTFPDKFTIYGANANPL